MIAASLLTALTGWIVPAKTAAQPIQKFDLKQKQIELAKESVIYKSDAPNQQPIPEKPKLRVPPNVIRQARLDKQVSVVGQYSGRDYSKEEVEALIRSYAKQYGANENLAVRIAYCESGYNQHSANRNSTARGVYQYLGSTWSNTPAGRSGTSVMDADANVRTAVQYIATKGTSPWNASRSCWS